MLGAVNCSGTIQKYLKLDIFVNRIRFSIQYFLILSFVNQLNIDLTKIWLKAGKYSLGELWRCENVKNLKINHATSFIYYENIQGVCVPIFNSILQSLVLRISGVYVYLSLSLYYRV